MHMTHSVGNLTKLDGKNKTVIFLESLKSTRQKKKKKKKGPKYHVLKYLGIILANYSFLNFVNDKRLQA